ncbi:MAG: hypothetical protein OSA38_01745 [Candidatus Poseidoniaceae archaeon]|nr:hypothetical protein [Candidatus Poseidoniaceae archaeon]
MRVINVNDLGEHPRQDMAGARWLVMKAEDIQSSTSLLMFTELDDIHVAVDHRGSWPTPGLWQRAVHCILIDGTDEDAEKFRRSSGITRVIAGAEDEILSHLW